MSEEDRRRFTGVGGYGKLARNVELSKPPGSLNPNRVPGPARYDEIIESLYNFDREELRRIAWECLQISDGPDKSAPEQHPVDESPAGSGSKFTVVQVPPVGDAPGKWGFVIRGREGWET